MSWRFRNLFLLLAASADGLMFKSDEVTKQWDTWAFVENGTYYAYYLITEESPGEGFGVATSPNGASNWTDHGYVWHGPAWEQNKYWQGTSSVWRAADFDKTGRYLINYSEYLPNNTQRITFAQSFNLLNWTRPEQFDFYFYINTTYYTDPGRWDTIYSVPQLQPGERDGYPRLGYWTASPIGGKGTFGFGITQDGYHWEALPSPTMLPQPIGAEIGAVEWIPYASGKAGGAWFAMLGYGWPRTMLTYSAPTAYGPWWRAPKNVNLLNGSCYFLRFFRGLKNELLVTHQSWTNLGTHNAYIAPYKGVEMDDEGTLRLTYWSGNEQLKDTELQPTPTLDPVVQKLPYLNKNLTMEERSKGVVLEAVVTIPTAHEPDWPGFVLELSGDLAPLAIVLTPGGEEVAIGDFLPQSPIPYSPSAVALPTTDWLFDDGASRMPSRDAALGGSDIRSGGPGQTSVAKLAHPLDSQGHYLASVHVCFQYVAGYGCGPQAPEKKGSTVTLTLLDAVNGSRVADVWTSDALNNYSYDVFTGESPPICGGADGLAVAHSRQLQLGLRFANNDCNLQLPMRTMNASVAWGAVQPQPYQPSAVPGVGVTERWTRDLTLGAPGERVPIRLLYRRDMVEFYVKDYVFMAIDIPPTTGRIGLTAANVTSALRWWPMALPGGNFVQGGSASVAEKRSYLAETIPQPYEAITKKTLRDCIPAEYFVRSYTHSLGALCWDLVMAGMAYAAVHWCNDNLPAYAVPVAWLAYWWVQGLIFTGLWVIGHECGHGGFTDSRVVNDTVGFVVHSALLAPYFSWAITHAKHHHYTNHMTMGETWVPSTANPEKKSVKFAKTPLGIIQRLVIIATVGWWAYLINNNTGARQNLGQSHFDPNAKSLFKKKDKNYVRASNVGMLLAGAAIAYGVYVFGFWAVCRSYLIPQMEANFYLAIITLLQHTHKDVPHFEDEQWTWLRGALSTIDRSMGPVGDYLTHYIVSSHVCHHIFSDMPYYGAQAATPYVKAHLGKYYKAVMPKPVLGSTYLGYMRDLWICLKTTVSVQKEEDGFMYFK